MSNGLHRKICFWDQSVRATHPPQHQRDSTSREAAKSAPLAARNPFKESRWICSANPTKRSKNVKIAAKFILQRDFCFCGDSFRGRRGVKLASPTGFEPVLPG